MENKKKVLFFIQDAVGGAERIAVFIGKNIDTESVDVEFNLVKRGSNSSIVDFIPKGIKISFTQNGSPFSMIYAFYKAVKNSRPDVVFSTAMYFSTKLLLFRFLYPKVKFVIRCENYLFTYTKRQRSIIRYTYNQADAIIVQTQEMADELVKINIDSNKIRIIENPVDKNLIDKMIVNCENPYMGIVGIVYVASGRFAYQKGFDLLIRSFSIVAESDPKCHLFILGENQNDGGKLLNEIIEYAIDKGIDNRVHCVGYQKNPYPYIVNADCFVLSSRWEGLPNVMIEALYLGTPVAAFNCVPIVNRIIKDGVNGYLSTQEDVNMLAACMQKTVSLGRIKNSYNPSSVNDYIRVLFQVDDCKS